MKSIIEIAREIIAIEIEGLKLISDQVDEQFELAVRLISQCKTKVIVTGIGKSGLIGRKISATLSSTGTPAIFVHPVEALHGDFGCVQDGDIVLAISNSGRTPELIALLKVAKQLGLQIVVLTGRARTPMSAYADIELLAQVLKEAGPFGITPTSSTTGMLALGDALALCCMRAKRFGLKKFHLFHPRGNLGKKLSSQIRTSKAA